MIDSQFIKSIKSVELQRYSSVSSREKLVVFAIDYLNQNNIETNWTNVCITAFKLFPERFYLSEEYKEYPAIERLNRTLLHLRPKEQNYAIGSSSVNYVLTPLGREVAKQVSMIIYHGNNEIRVKEKVLEKNQHTQSADYNRFITSSSYLEVLDGKMNSTDFVWQYFEVTPYTQVDRIKKKLTSIQDFSELKNDTECSQLITKILQSI